MHTANVWKVVTAALTVLVALTCVSCSTTAGPSDDGPAAEAIPTRSISGGVSLPMGSTHSEADLTVLSLAGSGAVAADGTFSVSVPDTDTRQTVVLVTALGDVVLLGTVGRSESSGVAVDGASTAEALVRMNPFLTMFSESDRAIVVESAELKPGWATLVATIESAVGSGAGLLEGAQLADASQRAAELAIDALNDDPAGPTQLADPWLEDADGDSVSWVNPDPVCYAAVFRSLTAVDSLVVPVNVDRGRVRVTPGWPPTVYVTGNSRTHVDIGDGTYRTRLVHSSFRDYDPTTPDGLATVSNAGRAVTEVVALISGTVAIRTGADLDLHGRGATELGGAVSARNPYRMMSELSAIIADESDSVAEWLWRATNTDCADFLSAVCPVLSDVVFATGIIADGETRVPFFSRLVTSDPAVEIAISQLDGVMTQVGSRQPPSAVFEPSVTFAGPGTTVTFDASGVTDPDDSTATLTVRWDWENDGVWDTTWSTDKTAAHQFSTAGSYEVVMQVSDPHLLNDSVVHSITVSGSEETAVHVVVVRDVVPWSDEIPAVLDSMLEVMGFTEGGGPNQYEVVTAASLGAMDLTPGEDLVIVQNDQPQSFYNDYADIQVRVQRFVERGGTIFWEACDRGWQGGSIESAGIVLPGNVTLSPYETWYNYVELPGAPLVEGLPEFLYGQYASHEAIHSLPDGAVVYITNDAGDATLAEYGVGDGWVLLSTQPLEWNFYNNWSSGQVMPHVVGHVLGLPLIHDFGDIVKPERRGRPSDSGEGSGLTSGVH